MPQTDAVAVSVFFLREMAKDPHEFLKEMEELFLKSFSKVAKGHRRVKLCL